MLLGLQLEWGGRDTIHSFFGVPGYEAAQGCSNYVRRCVEPLSVIFPQLFIHTYQFIYIHLFLAQLEVSNPCSKILVTFGPPCIREKQDFLAGSTFWTFESFIMSSNLFI